MIKPPKLQKGDKVALISLSWGGANAFPLRYEIGKKQIAQTLGLEPIETKYSQKSPEWLEKNPEARAEDLMNAFADPSIKAIFSIIGGDDSYKLIPFVDLNVITKNPKVFLGYSDTTTAHLMCYKAGLSSFYGPSVMTGLADGGGILPYTVASLQKTLFSNDPLDYIADNNAPWSNTFTNWGDPDQENKRRAFFIPKPMKFLNSDKKSHGKLIGGCIETLIQLTETELWPDKEEFKEKILFLEISEDCKGLNDLKENLRYLKEAGIFSGINGILFGKPSDSIEEKDHDVISDGFSSYCRDELNLDVPILCDASFGHNDPVFIIPYGTNIIIDPLNKQIIIDESAVI